MQFDELVEIETTGYIRGGFVGRQRRSDLLGCLGAFLIVGHV